MTDGGVLSTALKLMSKKKATNRKRGAVIRSTVGLGHGTSAKRVGPVTICCMKPEYRDCLERAMDAWKKHRQELPKKVGGKRYVPGIYAFAYWLIRWSGIVKPACPNTEVSDAGPVASNCNKSDPRRSLD